MLPWMLPQPTFCCVGAVFASVFRAAAFFALAVFTAVFFAAALTALSFW
jgi:hypothetical protein